MGAVGSRDLAADFNMDETRQSAKRVGKDTVVGGGGGGGGGGGVGGGGG